MQKDYGMYQGYNVEEGQTTSYEMPHGGCNNTMQGMECQPVYECPCERVVHREVCHHVPHICPIKTKICTHHIYKHTYTPCYSCCEENDVCNVGLDNCCNKF